MGPADSRRIPRAPRYSGYHSASSTSRVRDFHPLRPAFPSRSTLSIACLYVILQPRRCRNIDGLGYSAFARHYLRNHFCFLLLWVLRCFSSPRSPPFRDVRPAPDGLPHSDIPASRVICTYTGLFAAYHVLLRLREPRHPPSALAYFLRLSPDSCPSGEQVDMSLACSSFCYLSSLLEVVQYVKDLFESFTPLSVENNGFEPLTLCLQSRCSSQLS